MARPVKKGLSYYPMDVDFYDDEKIVELMMRYGPLGCAVYQVTVSMIYRSGYYLEMPIERLVFNIVRKIGSGWTGGMDPVVPILECCAELELFDSGMYRRGILTSRGIQRRYIQVASRRKLTDFEHWLLDDDFCADCREGETETGPYFSETGVSAAENVVNPDLTPLKKSKENKSKSNKRKKEKKEEKSPAPAEPACGDDYAVLDNPAARVYERIICRLTETELAKLEELCLQYGNGRVIAAVMEMGSQGGEGTGCVEAILRRTWRADES